MGSGPIVTAICAGVSRGADWNRRTVWSAVYEHTRSYKRVIVFDYDPLRPYPAQLRRYTSTVPVM